MTISVTCDHCGGEFRAQEAHVGRRAKCPECGESVLIQDSEAQEDDDFDFDEVSSTSPPQKLTKTSVGDDALWVGLNQGLFGLTRKSGLACLLLGLVLAVGSRGCDGIAASSQGRDLGNYKLAQSELRDKYDDKRKEVEEEISELEEDIRNLRDEQRDADDAAERTKISERISSKNEKMSELREKVSEFRSEETKERTKLERGDWRALKIAARDASAKNMSGRYWRQWAFVLGSLLLVVGLIVLGFIGEENERKVCLVMIGIITFSIYVGGVAWVDSLITNMMSMAQGMRM